MPFDQLVGKNNVSEKISFGLLPVLLLFAGLDNDSLRYCSIFAISHKMSEYGLLIILNMVNVQIY